MSPRDGLDLYIAARKEIERLNRIIGTRNRLDVQDRVADAIWFVPPSDTVQAHYAMQYSVGPKGFLNVWLGRNYGEESTEWSWSLHESAVLLWLRDDV